MNQKTLDFISEHWKLLLEHNAQDFKPLISSSPLQSVVLILDALRDGSLSLQELSDRTNLHLNSVKSITRVLEGKLCNRVAQGFQKGNSTLVSLSVGEIGQLSATPNAEVLKTQKRGMYRCRLPAEKFYRSIQSQKEGQWVFEDMDSITFRIYSPVPNPWAWDKEWNIWTSKQRQKSDNESLNTRVDFKLFLPESKKEVLEAQMEREVIKGYFAWAENSPSEFFVSNIRERFFLAYSFINQKHSA